MSSSDVSSESDTTPTMSDARTNRVMQRTLRRLDEHRRVMLEMRRKARRSLPGTYNGNENDNQYAENIININHPNNTAIKTDGNTTWNYERNTNEYNNALPWEAQHKQSNDNNKNSTCKNAKEQSSSNLHEGNHNSNPNTIVAVDRQSVLDGRATLATPSAVTVGLLNSSGHSNNNGNGNGGSTSTVSASATHHQTPPKPHREGGGRSSNSGAAEATAAVLYSDAEEDNEKQPRSTALVSRREGEGEEDDAGAFSIVEVGPAHYHHDDNAAAVGSSTNIMMTDVVPTTTTVRLRPDHYHHHNNPFRVNTDDDEPSPFARIQSATAATPFSSSHDAASAHRRPSTGGSLANFISHLTTRSHHRYSVADEDNHSSSNDLAMPLATAAATTQTANGNQNADNDNENDDGLTLGDAVRNSVFGLVDRALVRRNSAIMRGNDIMNSNDTNNNPNHRPNQLIRQTTEVLMEAELAELAALVPPIPTALMMREYEEPLPKGPNCTFPAVNDVTLLIFSFIPLDRQTLFAVSKVCAGWRERLNYAPQWNRMVSDAIYSYRYAGNYFSSRQIMAMSGMLRERMAARIKKAEGLEECRIAVKAQQAAARGLNRKPNQKLGQLSASSSSSAVSFSSSDGIAPAVEASEEPHPFTPPNTEGQLNVDIVREVSPTLQEEGNDSDTQCKQSPENPLADFSDQNAIYSQKKMLFSDDNDDDNGDDGLPPHQLFETESTYFRALKEIDARVADIDEEAAKTITDTFQARQREFEAQLRPFRRRRRRPSITSSSSADSSSRERSPRNVSDNDNDDNNDDERQRQIAQRQRDREEANTDAILLAILNDQDETSANVLTAERVAEMRQEIAQREAERNARSAKRVKKRELRRKRRALLAENGRSAHSYLTQQDYVDLRLIMKDFDAETSRIKCIETFLPTNWVRIMRSTAAALITAAAISTCFAVAFFMGYNHNGIGTDVQLGAAYFFTATFILAIFVGAGTACLEYHTGTWGFAFVNYIAGLVLCLVVGLVGMRLATVRYVESLPMFYADRCPAYDAEVITIENISYSSLSSASINSVSGTVNNGDGVNSLYLGPQLIPQLIVISEGLGGWDWVSNTREEINVSYASESGDGEWRNVTKTFYVLTLQWGNASVASTAVSSTLSLHDSNNSACQGTAMPRRLAFLVPQYAPPNGTSTAPTKPFTVDDLPINPLEVYNNGNSSSSSPLIQLRVPMPLKYDEVFGYSGDEMEPFSVWYAHSALWRDERVPLLPGTGVGSLLAYVETTTAPSSSSLSDSSGGISSSSSSTLQNVNNINTVISNGGARTSEGRRVVVDYAIAPWALKTAEQLRAQYTHTIAVFAYICASIVAWVWLSFGFPRKWVRSAMRVLSVAAYVLIMNPIMMAVWGAVCYFGNHRTVCMMSDGSALALFISGLVITIISVVIFIILLLID